MEINEVYDEVLELSLFSSIGGVSEIYFNYGHFYGIIYAEATTAHERRNEIKKELEAEYRKNKQATGTFINEFVAKHDVQLPDDIYFDFSLEDFLDKTS
jgi:hypothetical protein